MTRAMRLRGGVAVLVGLALPACYKIPQTIIPDAGAGDASGVSGSGGAGGTGGAGTAGRGGSSGAGAVDGGMGGASGRGGSVAGATGVGAAGGVAGDGGTGGHATCNPACDATHVCSAGRCLLADAQQCVTGSQCASGTCNPFYADVDGDGFGTGQPVGFCTLTTPPIGYAAQTGDCCDDAANIALAKLIHPGADFHATSAGGICGGITWDYNCSGAVESDPKFSSDCTADCSSIFNDYPESACGNRYDQRGCQLTQEGPNLVCVRVPAGTPLVSCR